MSEQDTSRLSSTGGRHARGAILLGIALAVAAACESVADEIALLSGDVVNGTIVERTDAVIILEHDVFGRLEVPLDTIATLNGEPLQPPSDEAAPPADAQAEGQPEAPPAEAEAEPAAEAPPAEEQREWKSQLKFGGSATFGNSDTQALNLQFNTVRETEVTRTAFDAAYFFGTTDGDRDTNSLTTGVLQDWFVPESRWLYFADARADYDEFESWEYRVSGHGGVGYEFIKEPDFDLTGRAGIGAIKEFNSDDESVRPEGLLGIALNWQISERQQLQFDTTAFPDFGEVGEFRWVTNADWSMLVDQETNMSVTAGLRHEYESSVGPDSDHSDLYLTAGLQLDF